MSDTVMFWSELVVAAATVAGVGFAGWQLLQYRRDQRDSERMEIEGVNLMWKARIRPVRADYDEVNARWEFEFTLTNPGRMPIDDVHCAVTFEQDIQRLRFDGSLSEPVRVLHLHQEVLAGSSTRPWRRTFITRFTGGPLPIAALVEFTDSRGMPQITRWPRARRAATARIE